MGWQQYILELLKIIISWPFVILVLGIWFLLQYRGAIVNFISIIAWRISHLKGPGGTEAILQSPSYDPALLQEVERARANEKSWFFGYLNMFFVYTTKQALIRIALRSGISSQDLFQQLRAVNLYVNQGEFNTIVTVLREYGMIKESNSTYSTTPLGQEYLNFYIRTLGLPTQQ